MRPSRGAPSIPSQSAGSRRGPSAPPGTSSSSGAWRRSSAQTGRPSSPRRIPTRRRRSCPGGSGAQGVGSGCSMLRPYVPRHHCRLGQCLAEPTLQRGDSTSVDSMAAPPRPTPGVCARPARPPPSSSSPTTPIGRCGRPGTADGPVMERAGRERGPPLAMRWVAHDPTDEIGALRAMGRATDLPSFEAAVAGFRSPEQNVVYADAAGNIAYFLAGHVPVRRGGAGFGPASGWATAGRWDGYLAAAELPRMVNPAQAYIVTANNRVIGDEYPFYISREWELPYRAQRILELVRRDSAATAGSVARAQLDIVDVFCRAIAPLAARAAPAAGRPDVAARLRAWDGAMSPERTEPTLVWSWYRELQRLVYDSVSPGYRPAEPLHRWLARGWGPWDDLAALERQAMATVLPRAAGRPWGSVHATVQEHPLSAVPLLGRLLRFNVGPLVTPGGNYTVNVASTDQFAAPFASCWRRSLRHVVDFGDVDGAGGFILPTGQSGD